MCLRSKSEFVSKKLSRHKADMSITEMSMTIKDSGNITSTTTQTLTRNTGAVTNTVFTKSVEHNYMVGGDIPHFHSKLKKGILLPHTSFHQYKGKYEWVSGSYYSHINPPSAVWSNIANFGASYQTLCILPVYPSMSETQTEMVKHYPGPDKSVLTYQVQRAAARIYSQGFDSLTFMAELPKMRGSLGDILKRMKKLKDKFKVKQLSLNEKDEVLESYFQLWLQYRYEWRVLLYDIQDLHGALMLFDEKRKIFSERSGITQSGISSKQKIFTGTDHVYTCDLNIHWEHSLRGAITARISPPQMQINPLVTAWELTKWSFILDWAVDVGTAIEALSFAMYNQEYFASSGIQTKLVIDQNITGVTVPTKYGSASMVHSGNVEIQTRTPTSVNLVPQMTGKFITSEKLLDIQAIIRSMRFKRRK